MTDEHRVKVDIFGQTYTLRGSADPADLARIAAQVDAKMNELWSNNPRLDLPTLAVLTALNFAQEYEAIAAEYEALLTVLEEPISDPKPPGG